MLRGDDGVDWLRNVFVDGSKARSDTVHFVPVKFQSKIVAHMNMSWAACDE